MKRIIRLTTFFSVALSFDLSIAQTVLYNFGFGSDDADSYQVTFGSPTVTPSFYGLSNALLFHATATYDQIQLPIETTATAYSINYDIVTHGLENSQYAFTLLLDTPEVRNVSMHGLLNAFDVFQPTPYTIQTLQAFTDDTIYHMSILVDLSSNAWGVSIDGNQVYRNTLAASELDSIRFSMAPWVYRAPDDPNASAAIDNLIVQTVPEPSAAWLLITTAPFLYGVRIVRASPRLRHRAEKFMASILNITSLCSAP